MPTELPLWVTILVALFAGCIKPTYDAVLGKADASRKDDQQEHDQALQDKDQMMRFAVEHINTLRADLDKLRQCLEIKEKEYYQCRDDLARCKGKHNEP